MKNKLRMTGKQHALLREHLMAPDGNEAVAFALCGRRAGATTHIFTIRQLSLVPYADCPVRTPVQVTWRTDTLRPLLDEAARTGMALVKFHSHPGGFPKFSETDDRADAQLFEAVSTWTDSPLPHGSMVMLPDGAMFGRAVDHVRGFSPLNLITVVGDDLRFYGQDAPSVSSLPGFVGRHAQAFGAGTVERLRGLRAAVVGCSGTGSVVVEQLVRLGVGELVLVDPDFIEDKNLNRILNSRMLHARVRRRKVDALADQIEEFELGCKVTRLPVNICTPEAVRAIAECDLVFGCMDGSEGRHVLNRLAVFYCLPYIDVGVRLEADGAGGVDQICGTVHYLQPDGSSLVSRGAITFAAVEAEGLKRTNPAEYAERLKAKYITGVVEDRPAVISVNMHYASLAGLELLARIHGYRDDGNADFAAHGSSLTQARLFNTPDGPPCRALARHVGRGDVLPLLELSSLSIAS